MLTAQNFKVGDWFNCEYNGKHRPLCEVIEIPAGRDYILVRTEDGHRNFKFHGITNMETVKLAP